MARGGSNVPGVSAARFKKLQTEVKNMGGTLTEVTEGINDLQESVGNAQGAITGTEGEIVVIGSDGKATTQALAGTDYTTSRVRGIQASTTDLTSGSSTLANGTIYLVYE